MVNQHFRWNEKKVGHIFRVILTGLFTVTKILNDLKMGRQELSLRLAENMKNKKKLSWDYFKNELSHHSDESYVLTFEDYINVADVLSFLPYFRKRPI